MQYYKIISGCLLAIITASCLTILKPAELKMNSTHGFRYDPMEWVENDNSLQGAMVRSVVFKTPKPGDVAKIRKELQKELKRMQKEVKDKVKPVKLELMEAGAALNLPEVKQIGKVLLAKGDKNPNSSTYLNQNLCHAGFGNAKAVKAGLQKRADNVFKENPWRCCPWGPALKVKELWYGRNYIKTDKALDHLIKILDKSSNPIGHIYDKDPWSFIALGGMVEHPKIRGMVLRAIPVILRGQKPDGGWGKKSFAVFRTLHRQNLIESLRKLPPLPKDWKIVKSIPGLGKKIRTLAWDGDYLWTIEPGKEPKLYAISPKTGKVIRTIFLDDERVRGVGCRKDGKLLFACKNPNAIQVYDPRTGKVLKETRLKGDIVFSMSSVAPVGDKIWAVDDLCSTIWEYDPTKPGKHVDGEAPTIELSPRYIGLAGPGPYDIAVLENSVWHADGLTPLLVRTSLNGRFLDWGEQPCQELSGITWDGKNLWVIDMDKNQIHMIEKSPDSTATIARLCLLKDWLILGPLLTKALPKQELTAMIKKNPQATSFRAGHRTDYLKSAGGEAGIRPIAGQKSKLPDGSLAPWKRYSGDEIQFYKVFPGMNTDKAVMYAFKTIESDKKQKVLLSIGSDDAVKVWLNGKRVLDHQVARGVRLDQDVVPVTLEKGTNYLLCKVENTGGGAGLVVRFVNKLPDGKYEGVEIK